MARIPKRAHLITHVETFEAYSHELDMIESGQASREHDLNFLNMSASAFVALLLAIVPFFLATPSPDRAGLWLLLRQIHIAGILVGGFATWYLYRRWRKSVASIVSIIQTIRSRAVGPLGEEGEEIKAAELEQLPAEEPKKDGS